jgi:SSS family transporter
MHLHAIDWILLVLYLVAALAIGIAVSREAGKDVVSYFLAGRKLPWWLLGTSIVATTFSADTPLAVTGIVAHSGVAGNWFWWSWALAHVLAVYVFAGLWRRSAVITDAELVELRYSGRGAASLRAFKAFYFSIVANCIVLAWVFRAMGKICAPFFHWELWLPARLYDPLAAAWPAGFGVHTPSEAISVLVAVAVTAVYTVAGGLKGVVVTDLVQFVLATGGAILFAVYAVAHVGGLSALVEGLHAAYPAEAEGLLSYFPSWESSALPLSAFLVYVMVQWWSTHNSDGNGYMAQRLLASRDESHARRATLLFVVLHYTVRTWPWVLVGLVALVVYPKAPAEGAALTEAAREVMADRERAYPVLMGRLLPPGALGLVLVSLVAAFMSTVDTHLNWGASYLVNDIYLRFLRPKAGPRELVRVSRIAAAFIAVAAIAVTMRISSIERAWQFLAALGSGLGLVHLLRWLWWRPNAYSEIAGMAAALFATAALYAFWPGVPYQYKLLLTAGTSAAAMLTATMLAPAVDAEKLAAFCERVDPPGFWGPVRARIGARSPAGAPNDGTRLGMKRLLAAWAVTLAAVFGLLFGVGEILLGSGAGGVLLIAAASAALVVGYRVGSRVVNTTPL